MNWVTGEKYFESHWKVLVYSKGVFGSSYCCFLCEGRTKLTFQCTLFTLFISDKRLKVLIIGVGLAASRHSVYRERERDPESQLCILQLCFLF